MLKNFVIFVPSTYLGMPAADLPKYGESMLRDLLKHFCGSHLGSKRLFVISGRVSIIEAEFVALKNALWKTVNE